MQRRPLQERTTSKVQLLGSRKKDKAASWKFYLGRVIVRDAHGTRSSERRDNTQKTEEGKKSTVGLGVQQWRPLLYQAHLAMKQKAR